MHCMHCIVIYMNAMLNRMVCVNIIKRCAESHPKE